MQLKEILFEIHGNAQRIQELEQGEAADRANNIITLCYEAQQRIEDEQKLKTLHVFKRNRPSGGDAA